MSSLGLTCCPTAIGRFFATATPAPEVILSPRSQALRFVATAGRSRWPTDLRPLAQSEALQFQIPIQESSPGPQPGEKPMSVFVKVWGAPMSGKRPEGCAPPIPVLFVHGGPGNCIEDYGALNAGFFDKEKFTVIEVDQRGTGRSIPSLRQTEKDDDDPIVKLPDVAKKVKSAARVTTPLPSPAFGGVGGGYAGLPLSSELPTLPEYTSAAVLRTMERYLDISIEQMSADFDSVRRALGIEKWLVFGGSWGSTLGLHYAASYPESCFGLIVRGIFLSTEEEMDAVYTRAALEKVVFEGYSAEKNTAKVAKMLHEFDIFHEKADRYLRESTHDANKLDPNDARQLLDLYMQMISQGDKEAIWKFWAFENNLMAESNTDREDPEVIQEELWPEAQSVSFFEAKLFLKGAYEAPTDLLQFVRERWAKNPIPTWVVQGLGDAVCPEKYARDLQKVLEEIGALQSAHFVDAGHKAGSPGINVKLKELVAEYEKAWSAGEWKKLMA